MSEGDANVIDEVDPRETAPSGGVGLCLSGGGYRAMLFHLGALRRLNEVGRLATLTRVASVSGGSIIAGLLGRQWTELAFAETDSGRVAQRFGELIEKPILDLAGRGIDVRAVLTGLRPGGASRRVQKFYDRHLFKGATLQDLPTDASGPRFIILATNLTNGSLWRFSRPYMRDWRTEEIRNPTLALAHAVAASSAFPPVLSPSFLDIPGRPRITLTDGGVYDNLGLEPVMKNCASIFVSDGGGSYPESTRPHTDWLRGTTRVLSTVDVQVRRLRRRQIMSALASGQRTGAFWAINTNPSDFPLRAATLPISTAQAGQLAMVSTRLAKLKPTPRFQIANWGYAVADSALRSYVDTHLAEPAGFPYPAAMT
ncbi:patatin-like phospholipase family protein [Mycobacterium sp. 1465703.0]|uniref:patatin-like phospholipase family protein n=1 Tax=Mycobacterium sp. 1465703.0 TaxID=1834078 RepID=UPI0007FE271A|nr:patatin-like phospholipase family protein [Mycobacterium sp. 1465703.0]OBJ08547.1 hypothetical protein A5625_14590 [Mycobacterium sp. 1465703.0]